mmetsp:Transcript_93634/g.292868  ORF Transcript_93634/g.292868 Transcript_93634/m.292868 type:complete len:217 (+) Transcript_93634:1289-1939(+)
MPALLHLVLVEELLGKVVQPLCPPALELVLLALIELLVCELTLEGRLKPFDLCVVVPVVHVDELLWRVAVDGRRGDVGAILDEPLQAPGRAVTHSVPGRRLAICGLRIQLIFSAGLQHVHVAVHAGNVRRAPAVEVLEAVEGAAEAGVGVVLHVDVHAAEGVRQRVFHPLGQVVLVELAVAWFVLRHALDVLLVVGIPGLAILLVRHSSCKWASRE